MDERVVRAPAGTHALDQLTSRVALGFGQQGADLHREHLRLRKAEDCQARRADVEQPRLLVEHSYQVARVVSERAQRPLVLEQAPARGLRFSHAAACAPQSSQRQPRK